MSSASVFSVLIISDHEVLVRGQKFLVANDVLYEIRDRESDPDYCEDEEWSFASWCGAEADEEFQLFYQMAEKTYSYDAIVRIIRTECSKITIAFSTEGDGRIDSAVKEKEYLDCLETALASYSPPLKVERPKERHWFDVRIEGIAINLKLTTGSTDNAFNKMAIATTLARGRPVRISPNCNFNDFYLFLKECGASNIRNRMSEYHYLVIHKQTGRVMLKSILDIDAFKKNPSNTLQINWAHEFACLESCTPTEKTVEKIQQLMATIQSSLRDFWLRSRAFIEGDIETDFAAPSDDA
jgi:hypothetical protein